MKIPGIFLLLGCMLLSGLLLAQAPATDNGAKRPEFSDLSQVKYPEMALKNGIHGTAHLRVYVDRDGNVMYAEAIDGDRFLRAECVSEIRKAHFKQHLVDGKPDRFMTEVILNFSGPKPEGGKVDAKVTADAKPINGLIATRKIEANYPSSVRDHHAGETKVKVIIDENGKVSEATLISGGAEFTDASLDAARRWEFLPYEKEGMPARVSTTLQFTFGNGWIDPAYRPPVPTAEKMPLRVRVSQGVSQGLLQKRVDPVYPPQAKEDRGTVVMRAIIGQDGKVKQLDVLSGPPMLQQSTIDAVRQWEYKPYYLNGKPVEVETQITVHYELSR